jgi:hypothetical protein
VKTVLISLAAVIFIVSVAICLYFVISPTLEDNAKKFADSRHQIIDSRPWVADQQLRYLMYGPNWRKPSQSEIENPFSWNDSAMGQRRTANESK